MQTKEFELRPLARETHGLVYDTGEIVGYEVHLNHHGRRAEVLRISNEVWRVRLLEPNTEAAVDANGQQINIPCHKVKNFDEEFESPEAAREWLRDSAKSGKI